MVLKIDAYRKREKLPPAGSGEEELDWVAFTPGPD